MTRPKNKKPSPERRRPRSRSVWRLLEWTAVWTFVVGLLALGYLIATLPSNPRTVEDFRGNTLTLRDSNGNIFANRGPFVGDRLTLDEIPQDAVHAILAIEDRRFYRHPGIDALGVLRAVWANMSHGGLREGGSTITQQLVKIVYLSRDRTLKRKLQEALLALWLERKYGKDEILAWYLNEVYFGAGAYGIDAAAKRYFGKSARTLDLTEAAVLAGLVRAPSSLSPSRDPVAARERAAVVLNAMVEAGYLSEKQAARAIRLPAPFVVVPETSAGRQYFVDWIDSELGRVTGAINSDLTVDTTIDLRLQSIAEKTIARWLDKEGVARHASQAALVAMTPTGRVLAMVGGRDFRESQFNRAVQARRQPGSLFKLFVYLAAFDMGYTPDSTVVDQPVKIGEWEPQNTHRTYRGEVTLREAFAESINSVAVQLADSIGVGRVLGAARSLGITSDLQPTPSLALGAYEVTLLEMTAAFAAIAGDGQRVEPYGMDSIYAGADLIHAHERAADLQDEPVLHWRRDEMLDLLQAVVQTGTGRAAAIDRPAFGKTGTTQDNRDAWFIGFTDDLVVGVWVGNDGNQPMKGVYGSGLPTHIWHDFLSAAYADSQPSPASANRRGSEDGRHTKPPSSAVQPKDFFSRFGDGVRSLFK